jgi:hypothetical protein
LISEAQTIATCDLVQFILLLHYVHLHSTLDTSTLSSDDTKEYTDADTDTHTDTHTDKHIKTHTHTYTHRQTHKNTYTHRNSERVCLHDDVDSREQAEQIEQKAATGSVFDRSILRRGHQRSEAQLSYDLRQTRIHLTSLIHWQRHDLTTASPSVPL